MKKLSQLITSIKPIQVVGNTDIEITDVINDSRKAREGVLFVAVKGVAPSRGQFLICIVSEK